MKKVFTGFIIVSAVLYVYCLYHLLFRGFYGVGMMLSENLKIRQSYNLIPFKTIAEYITAYIDGSMRGVAFRNLAGNFFLLAPLGFYLPFFTEKMKKTMPYILTVAASIIAIEVVQLATMSGSLDIDDFILNFAGALIGFIVFTRTPARALFRLRAWNAEGEQL